MDRKKDIENYGNMQPNVIARNVFSKNLDGWPNLRDAFLNIEYKYPADMWDEYPEDSFKPNSDNYRCDEFTDKHDGKHILFSGCSVTYGQGLYTSETWSNILYKKISETEKLSGYFNLGTPGRGINDIVASIFKYCDRYGNPDAIFIDLPDTGRGYFVPDYAIGEELNSNGIVDFDYVNNKARHTRFNDPMTGWQNSILIYIYQSLMMLEVYCKSNKIDLNLYTYVIPTEYFVKNCGLNNFYDLPTKEVKNKIFEYSKKNKDVRMGNPQPNFLVI